MSLTSQRNLWPLSGSKLIQGQGSLWSSLADDKQEQADMAELRAQILGFELDRLRSLSQRHLIQEADDFSYSARASVTLTRVSTTPLVYELPPSVISISAFHAGELFEAGRDFRVRGNRLEFFKQVELGEKPTLYAHSVYRYEGDVTSYWCKLLRLATPEKSWQKMLRILYEGVVANPSELKLRQLVAAIFEVDIVTKAGKVLDLGVSYDRPIVITDKETLTGAPGDTSVVNVGDLVAPGDFVFASVEFYDFTVSAPPAGLSSLRIPARYFPPGIEHPIEFANTLQNVTATADATGIHIRFPITAYNEEEEDRFWEFVESRQSVLGYGLAQFLTNHPRPTIDQIPAQVIPLQLIHSLWLNLGVSASVVRLKPTTEHLSRLALLRRLVVPWLTHFIHFDQIEPQPYDVFC